MTKTDVSDTSDFRSRFEATGVVTGVVTLLLVTVLVIFEQRRPRLLSMPVIVEERFMFKGDKFRVLLADAHAKLNKYVLLM